MFSFPRAIFVFATYLGICLTSAVAIGQTLPSPTTAATSANTPVDPLGRTTPTGTMLGFLQAAQAGDYGIAAQYLQMSPARRQSEGEQMATKLKVVLDNAFTGRFKNFHAARRNSPGRCPARTAETWHHVVGRCRGRPRLGARFGSQRGQDLADFLRHSGQSSGTVRASRKPATWRLASPTCSSNMSSPGCRCGNCSLS